MNEHFDAAIIGGAVVGSATAFFLSTDRAFQGRVLVIEKDFTYANAASSRSTSGFRQQFSTPINVKLSKFSAAFIKDANAALRVPGEEAAIPVVEAGYLYLASPGMAEAFTANNDLQRALGVDVALLDSNALARRFPWLSVDDIAVGSLGLSGEGWTDGYLLTNALRRHARHNGVTYSYSEVTHLAVEPGGRYRIRLTDGATVTADQVVNTAGTSAPRLAAMLGVTVPVRTVKQTVFNFASPFGADRMPFVFTPDGLFLRPERDSYLVGIGIADDAPEVALDDMTVDYALFDSDVVPKLTHRVPAFAAHRFKGGWAGHYDMSLFDHNPFIGGVAGLPGYFMASGFSGHGLQHAPGVGRALAELVAHGRYVTLDLSELAFDRIAKNAPVYERIQY